MLLILMLLPAFAFPAASGDAFYQLHGVVVMEDGKIHRGTTVIQLSGAITPFITSTQAGADGRFTIKKLKPGIYTLSVYVPRYEVTRKTIEIGPSFADAKNRVRAEIRVEQRLPEDNTHVVAASQLQVPQNALMEYLKAQECLGRDDLKCAVARLNKAVDISPQFSTAWNNLGTIAYQTQRYGEAEKYFREALKHDPESYPPLVNLGGALLSEGQFEEALKFNKQAVSRHPDDALAQSQLGQNYFRLGRMEDARERLEIAVRLDPAHFSFPLLFLAQIYEDAGRFAEAAAQLKRFLELHPDSEYSPSVRKRLKEIQASFPSKP